MRFNRCTTQVTQFWSSFAWCKVQTRGPWHLPHTWSGIPSDGHNKFTAWSDCPGKYTLINFFEKRCGRLHVTANAPYGKTAYYKILLLSVQTLSSRAVAELLSLFPAVLNTCKSSFETEHHMITTEDEIAFQNRRLGGTAAEELCHQRYLPSQSHSTPAIVSVYGSMASMHNGKQRSRARIQFTKHSTQTVRSNFSAAS